MPKNYEWANSESIDKHVNIGVAAHIHAAAPNGPRFDENMTTEERMSIDNGIWLCQSCSNLIDKDIKRYTSELLLAWKETAEHLAIAELQSKPADTNNNDKDLIKFYSACFTRPAFQDDIRNEVSMEDLDKALEDTIIALNTGVLRMRDGDVLKTYDGLGCVLNPLWRKRLFTIVELLKTIRKRLYLAKADKLYWQREDGFYCFNDYGLIEWLNSSRCEIIKIFSSICKDAGLPELYDLRHYRGRFEHY